jgi:hypothetical protein
MIDADAIAADAASTLRRYYLNGVVAGLEEYDVGVAELPTLLGFMFADGIGDPRWSVGEWIDALRVWIGDRIGIEKGPRRVVRPGVDGPAKAQPNWLKPHELEAWTYARNRAGLRIEGLEDNMRARLRTIMGDAIALARPREQTIAIIAEKMEKAFESVEKDWKRIATTEMAMAFNEGVTTVAVAKGTRRFKVVTSSGACPSCRSTYDGRTFDFAELVPVMPPRLHPNCRCCVVPA